MLPPMQIHCPNCGALIPTPQIDPQTKVARCPTCGMDFQAPQAIREEIVERLVGQTNPGMTPPYSSARASPAFGVPSVSRTGSGSGSVGPIWFGLIFACMGMIFVVLGITLVVQQRYRIATYQPVDATILSTSISTHTSTGRHSSTTYEPVISYVYTVNGHRYTSRHVMPGTGSSASLSWAQGVIKQYRPKTKTTAWYSPADASMAFLIHRLDEGPYIFAMFPAIFLVVGIGLAINSRRANRPVRAPVPDGHGRFTIAEAGTIRGRFRTVLTATLIWYAYSGLLLLDYARVNGLDLFAGIALPVCGALGLIGVYFTYRKWQQAHDFLDAELTISQPQICPGDTIQFRIRQGVLEPLQLDKLSVTVVCVRDDRVRYGNKTTYTSEVAWSHSLDFPLNRMYRAGGEVEARQGSCRLPAMLAPSSPHRVRWKYPRYRWHIELTVCPQSMRPLVVRYPLVVVASAVAPASGQVAAARSATA